MIRMHRILLPAAALLLAAWPLRAQTPVPVSDVTGGLPTGSGIAGMGYPVVPVRDIEGALFRQVNGRSAFRSRAIADAVLGEAAAAYGESCSGTLRRPRDWHDSTAIPADTLRILCAVLGRPGLDTEEARRMLNALRGGLAGHPGDPAERLVAALAGLAHAEPSFVDERQRFMYGGRWEEVFRAYDAFLEAAPDALLDPPSAVLVAIAAVLDRLVEAGIAASER
jgi:hypothetical protein